MVHTSTTRPSFGSGTLLLLAASRKNHLSFVMPEVFSTTIGKVDDSRDHTSIYASEARHKMERVSSVSWETGIPRWERKNAVHPLKTK